VSPTADKPGREKGEVCHGVEEKSCGSSAVWVSSRGYRHQGLNHRGGVVDLKSKPNMSKNMFTYLSLSLFLVPFSYLSFFFFLVFTVATFWIIGVGGFPCLHGQTGQVLFLELGSTLL